MLFLVWDYKNNICSSVLSSENTEKAKKINREHCHQPILCCYYVSILCIDRFQTGVMDILLPAFSVNV